MVSVMNNSTVNENGITKIALTKPNTSYVLAHLILIRNPWVWCYYYSPRYR